ncbi:MAG TPA: PQQ-binding-like beta-propeller repeat protein [bacterium]|nr:PQQ-binding-like beta-propeller repeat protein [bacterium]
MIGRHRFALTLGVLVLLGLVTSSASFAQGDVWPTYLYDARNSGRCPWVGPNGPFLKWTYPGLHGSSVTIATDGTLRFTSEWPGNAYALNPDSSLRWTYDLGGNWAKCAPAIASDSSIIAQSRGASVYRIDKGGSLVWSYDGTVGGDPITSPVIADDLNLVFCIEWDEVHAIYMSGPLQGTAAWTKTFIPQKTFWETSPAFYRDTVYITGRDSGGSGVLVALDASTGAMKWEFPPGGIDQVRYSSPSVSEDGEHIYFGDSGDSANEYVLYCVASDGTLGWAWDSPEAGAGILNAPAIGTDGTLYIVDTKANLFAIASGGTLKWSVQLGAGTDLMYASAIIDATGTIYVTGNGGLFFGVSPLGRLCWSYDLGYDEWTCLSAGSIGTDGTLYFCTYDSPATLYAFHTGSYLTNPAHTPDCGSSATIFEFTVDCSVPPTVATLAAVQAHLDDGTTVVDLHFDSGVTWIGTVSSLAAGPYQYYMSYETWGGITGTYPDTGWLDAMDVDNTPPTSTCWCDSQCFTSSPIEVGFTSSDYFTGVTRVSLWYRRTPDCEGQKWWGDWTYLMSTDSTVGVFSADWSLEGRIEFLTIAEDCANIEAKSTADCWTKYDDTVPVTYVTSQSSCWGGPTYPAPIRVDYDVDESCTYEPDVELWYQYDGGSWTYDQKEEGSGSEGYFNFIPTLDGEYTFGCVTTDNCGNDEGTPSTTKVVIYDTTPPTSVVTDAPTCDSDGTFDVDVAANDPSISPNMSGIEWVALYYQYNGGGWHFYGWNYYGCVEDVSDTIQFVASLGDGTYGFTTAARDCCNNTEAYPGASTPADMETIVDTTSPRSRAISPDMENDPNTILVDYVASDETSGVDYVKLYYNLDGDAWHPYIGAGNTQAGETGTFPFAVPGPGSNGVYGFYTVAYDNCGNEETLPVDETPPDCSTVYDDIKPLSWPLTCTDASQGTLLVSGLATDNLTGISATWMFYRKVGGSYYLYGSPPILTYWMEAPGDLAFTYSFLADAGDGEYEFYFIAEDTAGNIETSPGDTITGFWDTTPPESSCWAADHYTNTTTLTYNYSAVDATMDVDELWLYYRFGDEDAFNATGSSLGGGAPIVAGARPFELQHGEGTYYFYTLAKDELGNWEVPPENADWWVMLDQTLPISHCISPKYATVSPIAVDFASEDMPSSGVEETQLWYRFNGGGGWIDSNLRETGEYGTFYFPPPDDDTYDFYTRALDRAGNLSAIPSSPHTRTIYDTTRPMSGGGCSSPVNHAPVEITYSATDWSPFASGLARVCLWHRYSTDGGTTWTPDWTFTGMCNTHDQDLTGIFYYDPTLGDGWYEFYLLAQDHAGLWESKATRDTYCAYTGTTPTSKADAPAYASDGTIEFFSIQSEVSGIEVGYSAYTPGAEVSDVTLWYRYESGNWNEYDGDHGYTAPTGSILFPWAAPHNEEGLYEFFTILEDTDGNVELAPPVPDTFCIHDVTPPWSSVEAVDEVSASTIYLDYVADDTQKDGITVSGLYSVSLWYSYEGGYWTLYDTVENAATAGTIIFEHPAASDGTFLFYTIAIDNAGNTEGIPSGPDDTTVYDGTPPVSAADPISPYYVSNPNITIGFTATDNYSGVAYVDLWYRYAEANSPWGYSGFRHLNPATGAGSFNFVATEGTVEFYTIATDDFGNVESPPSSADTSVCYDVTPPVSEVISTGGTTSYNYQPIPIYYAASDEVSGINLVYLHYRVNGGSWTDSGLVETATDGEFLFVTFAGAGTYEFYTIALDNAGNIEAAPTGDFHTVLYDLQAPTSSATGPLYTAVPDINVAYTASDDLSGIALVGLLYRFGDGGWAPWLDDYGDSTIGTIALTLPYGEGNYYIFSQSVDNAGNVEDWKSTHDIVTIYDSKEPDSYCFCAEYSTSSPIPVRFAAVDPDSSGIAEVCLQYNWEGTGWQDSGLCDTNTSGTFDFVPLYGPGTYQFRSIATDNSGNQETPSVADCETVYDDVFPVSECTCATVTTSAPIDIDFESHDATGTFDSVALWLRYSPDLGTTWTIGWQESGMLSGTATGTLEFDPTFGDGLYEFYTIASDMAGNIEAAPSARDCFTTYTSSQPTSFGTAPAIWNGSNIPVSYTATIPSGATLDTVRLWWRRYVGPDYTSWHQFTDEYGTETVGTIYFDYPVSDALYEFYTIVRLEGGTYESVPTTPDCACQLDTGDPTSSCTSDAFVEDVPIMVNFTAADGVTNVADVVLWFNFGGGSYSDYAEHQVGTSGYFVFDPPSGQGTYGFYTIATDEAGNVEAPPGSPPDTQTTWDISKPSSDCISGAPDLVASATMAVNFTSSDPVSNGVTLVGLWYNLDGGAWKHSGLEVLGTNILAGTFDFTALEGDGLYGFFTIAEDNWGNVEDPAATADDTTLVDTTPPQSSCSAPLYYVITVPVTVNFTATDGTGNVSGMYYTAFWYRFNGGTWTWTGQSPGGKFGSIDFVPTDGDGLYEFYTLSTDVAGNSEAAPGSADCSFVFDTQAPEASAMSPYCVTTPSINVDFTSFDAGPAGVSRVYLYYRYNGSVWIYWDHIVASYGTFVFLPSLEGTYEFAARARDRGGNYENYPGAISESTTIYDATPPWSSCESPECAVDFEQITVSFTAGDAPSGVASTELWVKLDAGAWTATGLIETGTSGKFVWPIAPSDFEGVAEFYTIAADNCGNVESPPLDAFGDVTFDTQTIVDWTAPESFCTAPSGSTDQNVEITWAATDATAGVAYTELWFSDNSERYEKCGEYVGTSGTVDFVMSSEGIYHFYTIGVDLCGNREARPAFADAITTFDTLGPTSEVEAPEYANSLPIVVRFTASDDVSGVASTSLFYCFDGLCAPYGEPVTGTSGEFLFEPDPALEGTYGFYTVSTDNMGNVEATPLSAEATTVYDRSAPVSSCGSPGIATSAPFDVPYIAIDNGPAGLDKVALWFKLDSGTWQEYTGDYGTSPLGAISFDPPGGFQGSYSLYTIATDKAGNVEARPGKIDATAVYDQTPPESSALVAEYSNSVPISVSFTTVETASGIASVSLMAKFGEAGVWGNTGLSSPNASGTFNYPPLAGEGRYFFYTIATDNAGFVETAPPDADASTLFDSTAPVTQLDAPAGVSTLPISLTFTCVEPTQLSGAPIDTVVLFYRFNLGSWLSTGLSANTETGTFNFTPTEGPGTYDFYSIGIDKAGNREAATGRLPRTVAYDITSPTSDSSCENTYRQLPLMISYTADGTGSGVALVELFYNYEGMGWLSTGLSLPGEAAIFMFVPAEGNGRYEFYTLATDAAGNTQAWDGHADCTCFFDTVAPQTAASAPEWTTSSPIVVHFAASDQGIGVAVVELWAQYESYQWQKVDEKAAATSGDFIFEPDVEGGFYSFYTIGRDLAGNVEASPATPDASTAFDKSAPMSRAEVPQYATSAVIDVGYAAIEAYSGMESLTLWCRYNRGTWFDTGYVLPGTSGTVAVTLTHGHGKYDFYTIGIDKAGNVESPPAVPDGSCFYDSTRPTSSCSCAQCTTELPLNVRFTAEDVDTRIAGVALLYRFNGGDWTNGGVMLSRSWGVFEFGAAEGEGYYEFYTIATNNAGWQELTPSAPDTSSYYDITLPSSSVSSPDKMTGNTIPVSFWAWDSLSGVKHVDLWYRYEERLWAKSGYRMEATSGTVDFIPPDGVGTYSFWTMASDHCGNTEPAPTTGATVTAVTMFDNVPPQSSVSVDEQYTNESPVPVAFTAADKGVGVASVRLWYSVGGSANKDTGLEVTGATIGVFDFVPVEGDGAYEFYSIAKDNFGNREATPSEADASVVFDTTPPFSMASSPDEAHATQVTVGFSATDVLSPVESVRLWYRYSASLSGSWGDWADAGLTAQGQAGLFPFEATQGEGYYEFYTIATDAAGNVEEPPASADSRTQYRLQYPEILVSDSSHNFGNVEVGTSSFWPELYVTNTGQAPLTIEGILIDNLAFGCSVLIPITIDPSTGMFLPIFFTPSHIGLAEGTLTIVSNDPVNPELEVALSGTGTGSTPSMSLELGSNGGTFYPGDTLSISLSCYNGGFTLSGVDLYVSLILPNGVVVYLPNFSTEPEPYASDLDVISGFQLQNFALLSAVVPEGFSPGKYVWRAYIALHGQDNEILASLPLVTAIDLRPEVGLLLDGASRTYGAGQKHVLSAKFRNDGLPKTVDLYVALQMPDGSLLFAPGLSPALTPCLDNYELPMHADVWPVRLFSSRLSSFPAGRYTWFAVFSDANSFSPVSKVSHIEWELE